MVDGMRLRLTPNLFYGICLVLIGWTFILDRLQIVEAGRILQYWPVGLVLVGLALVVQSLQRPETPPAGRGQHTLNGGHIIVWVIIALLVSHATQRHRAAVDSGSTVSLFAVLGHHRQTSRAPVFAAADMTSVMGRADLDLRHTTVAPGEEAVIDVFTLFGGSTIRVPEGWTVVVQAVPIAGAIKDRRSGPRDVAGSPRLVVRGYILMGGLDLRS